jgi:hypothetical protein
MLDPSSRLQARHDVVFLGQPFGRNDQRDVPSNGPLGRVAEQALGPGIPALNHAVERLTDNRVVGRLDDRCEKAGGQQLPRLVLVHTTLERDVPEGEDAPGDQAALVPD